jgi:hypothetical protein
LLLLGYKVDGIMLDRRGYDGYFGEVSSVIRPETDEESWRLRRSRVSASW